VREEDAEVGREPASSTHDDTAPVTIRRRCIAEAIGTFGLVFAGTGAIIIDHVSGGTIGHVGIALTFGAVVMAMIYAIGEVSGAHINPAVTIGFWLAGRLPLGFVGPYVLSQVLGACMASVLLLVLFPGLDDYGVTRAAGPLSQAFGLEVVLTAMLMFVILCVATGSKEQGLMAGIAVGGTVGLEATFAGPVSGASMNPARSLAPALVSWDFSHLWIYLVATVLGAAVAVPFWRLATGGDRRGAASLADARE